MTSSSRKKKHGDKNTIPPVRSDNADSKKQGLHIFALLLIITLAAIPFALGKYFEFSTPGAFDSGAYVYSAKHVLDGAKIGIDELPSAQIGTLLVNILGVRIFGFNEIGPEIIQMLLQATALIFMFVATRKVFGQIAAGVAVITTAVFLSAPLIAKFGNVKEQYMIAFMIIGISSFILSKITEKKFWVIIAGAALAWAPLFKQTGMSAIGAVGLFVILQPILKNSSWKKMLNDIALLFAGAAISLGPIYCWMIAANISVGYYPYYFVWQMIPMPAGNAPVDTSYVETARKLSTFSEQCPRVLRYYGLLIMPIAMAVISIFARLIRMLASKLGKLKPENKKPYDKFVLLFATWWILDMAFVWISPRSYEQYYLPLNASAAMLAAYIVAIYSDKLKAAPNKPKWVVVGIWAVLVMVSLSWHIFAGIEKSPHSGQEYGGKKRGYAQKLQEVKKRKEQNAKGSWEHAGEYIYRNSSKGDKIYVWGWVPGIYVKAQRLSSAKKAFTSEMHVQSPHELSQTVDELLSRFNNEMPKFIVDTHKIHFPWKQPSLELWPMTQKGPLPNHESAIAQYDQAYKKHLQEKVGEDEMLRYEAMKPFRDFVMKNYTIEGSYGNHVIFKLK